LTCPLSSTQKLIVRAFGAAVNPNLLKMSKFFRDDRAAVNDKARDNTESPKQLQVLFSKFLKNIHSFSVLNKCLTNPSVAFFS